MFEPFPANYRYAVLLYWARRWGFQAAAGYCWRDSRRKRSQ